VSLYIVVQQSKYGPVMFNTCVRHCEKDTLSGQNANLKTNADFEKSQLENANLKKQINSCIIILGSHVQT